MPLGEKLALLRAAGTLLLVGMGLRLMQGDRLARLLGIRICLSEPSNCPRMPAEAGRQRISEDVRFLHALLSRHPFRSSSSCLRDSLSVAYLLRSTDPCLHLGVASRNGRVNAHAWVETGGGAYFSDPAFLPLVHG